MTDSNYIFKGENYEEALKKGLEVLKASKEDVIVTILEEIKGSFFKKPVVTLNIKPKEIVNDNKDSLNDDIKEIVEDETKFTIKFQEDGVFLSVFFFDRPTELLSAILEYTKIKEIKEVDNNKIKTYINEANPEPILIAPYQEEQLVDESIDIEFSKDKMEAYISLRQAYGGNELSAEDIKTKLNEQGIVFGIDEVAIKDLCNVKSFKTKTTAARGRRPINGENAKIVYYFDVQSQKTPQILEDGSVDFKQLNLIKNVKADELLAEIIPPTQGLCGYNVLGTEIPPVAGKPLNFKKGKNTNESEDGLKLFANRDGQVLIKDGAVTVSEIYEVKGDVDNSTGNIKFNGQVIVKGNVKSGFTIEADGDIIVYGVVEGARLKANGNIVLNRGVQGNNQAYLECTGNLIAKYIENTNINVLGNIEADCILHSNTVAKAKVIITGKKGLIAGGEVKASEEIRAITIGSHMGTNTKLEVGVDPEEKRKLVELKNEIKEMETKLDSLRKTIELLNRLSQNASLTPDKHEIFVKSIKSYELLKEKYSMLKIEFTELEGKQETTTKAKIHAAKTIYPGVRATILNNTRQINDEIHNCTLLLKEGEVVIGPYEK